MTSSSPPATVRKLSQLAPEAAEAVRELVRSTPGSADNPPISEHALLQLSSAPPVRHLLATDARGSVLGYAQLDQSDGQAAAELVAQDPAVADQLIAALDGASTDGQLRVWAHGAGGVADQAALRAGLTPVRTLLQLRRRLSDDDLAETPLPDGIGIRAFVPGADDARWLALNGQAFASHPEQGSWTQRDLDERIRAPWFDVDGFLLADRASGQNAELVGFHWTKVHAEAVPPVGEVYVLGVDPAAQGMRLGKLLLHAGLRHLRRRGLDTVLLYVERDNATALGLYQRAGFADYSRDIQYARR